MNLISANNQHTHARAWLLLALMVIAIASTGCATVAPLNEAQLRELALASPEDMARYAQAQQRRAREFFGGASFSDGRGTIIASFSANEYDEYLSYVRSRPDLDRPFFREVTNWPTLRLTFQSRQLLFDPQAASMPQAIFYLCDEASDARRLAEFGRQDVMWRGRFVISNELALEIATTVKTEDQDQTYEVFFNYVYWDQSGGRTLKQGDSITLLPLPGDLCVSLHRDNYPLPASVGSPLRIDRELINGVVGTLPRTFSVEIN